MTTLNQLGKMAFENSMNHGFWDDSPSDWTSDNFDQQWATYLGNKLMLVVGEVSEAHEELRKNTDPTHVYFREDGKPEGLPYELADVLIRVFDLVGALGLDMDELVANKAAYNAKRPVKHGKAF